MMVKRIVTILLVFCLCVLLVACNDNGSENKAAETEKSEEAQQPEVTVPYDLEEVKNNQQQVDQGHSPWQLDPLQVTQTFVSLQISPSGVSGEFPISIDDLSIIKETASDTIVAVNSDKTAISKVYLKRLVRQDETGIWTVVGYDIDENRQPSIGGIHLNDPKETVEQILGTDYQETYDDEAAYYPETHYIWQYDNGYCIIIGKDSGKVLEIIATATDATTNLGAKMGDSAATVLPLYREKYPEPDSNIGGILLGSFIVEQDQLIVFDFDINDGMFNHPDDQIPDTATVERIILTDPTYIDDVLTY